MPAETSDPKSDPTKKAAAPAKPEKPAGKPMYWKVTESKKISVNGVVTQFHKDMVLNAAHYSHDGIAALKRAGLPMVETEKPEEYI